MGGLRGIWERVDAWDWGFVGRSPARIVIVSGVIFILLMNAAAYVPEPVYVLLWALATFVWFGLWRRMNRLRGGKK